MTSFIATYNSASGQTRTITIKAADLTTAKNYCAVVEYAPQTSEQHSMTKQTVKNKKAKIHQIGDYFPSISEKL